jgi:hypothetical protein
LAVRSWLKTWRLCKVFEHQRENCGGKLGSIMGRSQIVPRELLLAFGLWKHVGRMVVSRLSPEAQISLRKDPDWKNVDI